MNILLCFPSLKEQQLFGDFSLKNSKFYWEGDKLNHPDFTIDTLLSGIGKTETTYKIQDYLSKNPIDLVFLVGVAGGSSELNLGDAFVVPLEEEMDQGVWVDGMFQTVFDLGLASADSFPYADGKLATEMPEVYWKKLPQQNGITVSGLLDDPEWSEARMDLATAKIESMEGSAFYYATKMLCVPSLEIRGISNHVGIRDKSLWKIEDAMNTASKLLYELLDKINHEI